MDTNKNIAELFEKYLSGWKKAICENVYFIYQGLLGWLFYNEKGHECTGWFVRKGDLMISVYSYFNQVPAAESIQALEPSILQYLSWQEVQTVYNDSMEADKLGRP